MNVDRLRAVQAEEREADSLRSLPDSFYQDVAAYIEELRDERTRAAAAADDPFGDESVRRLTDEIETAEEVAEAIYERRVGKLVKRASLAAAGMPADEEGLTAEEAELFADLVEQIETHRARVLATFEAGEDDGVPLDDPSVPDELDEPDPPDEPPRGPDGESGSTASDGVDAGAKTDQRTSGAGTSDGGERPGPDPSRDEGDDAGPEESTDGGDSERLTLRVTRDVGEVFGVDERTYELAAEDVVTLPAANAKPLLERDAAEQIE